MIINEHTNSDGEAFYSTRDNDGEMIYSSTEDFEVTWDQATEDAAQAEREAWVKAEAAEAAEAARTAEAREEAREAEARAIRAHGTRVAAEAEARMAWVAEARMAEAREAAAEAARTAAAEAEARAEAWASEAEVRASIHREAQEAEARRVAWVKAEARDAQEAEAEALRVAAFAEAAEAPEFWIIDLDHPAESRGEFPASGPYPTQAAAEKYIISDTKAIWADSSPFSSQRFCQPLKIVKVIRTVQPEVTATVALVDPH